MNTAHGDFVPAAGHHWLLPLYDPFMRLFTRERRWRGAIVDSLDLAPNDIVVDVGCGTGSLAVMAKEKVPQATVIGIDPDRKVLNKAEAKARHKGLSVALHMGFGNDVARLVGAGQASKIVSSLAFHHMQAEMQAETLASIRRALKSGGLLRIADFASASHLPGPTGRLASDIAAAGFQNVRTLAAFRVAFADVVLVGAEKPHGEEQPD